MNEVRSFLLRHRHWAIFVVLMVGGYAATSLAMAPSQSGSSHGFSPGQRGASTEPVYPSRNAEVASRRGAQPEIGADAGKEAGGIPARSYSIPLPELSGLPSDLAPGTSVELWVAWERPFTRGPRVQRLLRDATFERIAPPATVEGSPVAVFSISTHQIADVVFADRFGSLSVATY